jgi:CHAT domain-containing protein
VFRLLLNPNSKKGISVPVSTYATTPKNIALLYPLILENRLELVVFLPDRPPIRRTVVVPRKQLEATIQSFSKTLNDPYTWDVKPHAQQLYNWLIQPFAADLQQSNTQTIVYSSDGQMRYVPLSALYDGQKWLTQRFQVNYLTALALTRLENRSTTTPRILAGAYTQGNYQFQVAGKTYSFTGLKYAKPEVEDLNRAIPDTKLLLDRDFNRPNIETNLPHYNTIHLATHAVFVPGAPKNSFVVLGDGNTINLKDVDEWKLPNVNLFVLSACETARGEQLGNGLEILGFGYQLQRAGVRSSISTLWKVDDNGTQLFMERFYKQLQNGNPSAVAALQQVQISMISQTAPTQGTTNRASMTPTSTPAASQSQEIPKLNHPYYWAPFILVGNGL